MEKALTGLVSWIDARLPLTRTWNTHMAEYYAPKNFNLWYFFGVFSLLVLVNQLLTGIWLTMNYTPSSEEAFCVGRVHHAGCRLRMVAAVHAFNWSICLSSLWSICI
jgi:hypothetical protein